MCICQRPIPTKRIGQMHDAQHKLVSVFHQDCPVHGTSVDAMIDMRLVDYKEWVTIAEFRQIMRLAVTVKPIRTSPDGLKALVEWSIWETVVEEIGA